MRKIEFVSYSGKYPNLCSGWLTLKVDGKPWKAYVELFSGGKAYLDTHGNEVVEQGPWDLSRYQYDAFVKLGFTDDEIEEVFRLLNEHVEFGCCGGCI